METPNNKAGFVTEKIMNIFSKYTGSIPLETSAYNRAYEHVFSVLKSEYPEFVPEVKRGK